MNWLAFVASLIDSLAWPAAIVIAVLVLRRPLVGLLPQVRKLRYRDFSLEFDRKLEELEAQAEIAKLPERSEKVVLPFDDDYPRTFQQYVARIAETSPRAAVAEAWRFVEGALHEVVEPRELPGPPSARAIDRYLRHNDPSTASLVRELRELRNRAVHAGDFDLTTEQAREYGELAVRLSSALYSESWKSYHGDE